MQTLLCLLILLCPALDGASADRTTVLARQGGREVIPRHGLDTMAEGLVLAALGDCSVEVGDDAANRKRWEEVLAGDHVRLRFARPRALSANVEKTEVVAEEIALPMPLEGAPGGRLMVRHGTHFRCFAKYGPEYWMPLQKVLRAVAERSAG
jgi:hypothetical protein